MRRAAAALLLAAAFTFLAPNPSILQTVEVSQACFPGFCVESRLPFIAIFRDPANGHYRLREYRSEATVYLQAGAAPPFPHCAAMMCRTETEGGEPRAFHAKTGRLMARLVGPLEACGGGPTLMVNLYVHIPTVDLRDFTITRKCG